MCVSVPQIPTAATRTTTSRDEICGLGTSRTSSRPTLISTHAFIVATSGEKRPPPQRGCPVGDSGSGIVVEALTLLPRHRTCCLEFYLNIACVQPPGIAQFRKSLHRLVHAGFNRSCGKVTDRSPDCR